jgi:hypothetical protein
MVMLAAGGATVAKALGGTSDASKFRVVALKLNHQPHALSAAQQHKLRLLRTADTSTRAKAYRVLRALGVNPRGVVIQRGAHNYAGPNCPGKRWTCTTARRVLQASGDSQFECTPVSAQVSPTGSPNDCFIMQTNGGSAKCVERSKTSVGTPIVQNCSIIQGTTPATGNNRAEIVQSADQNDKGACTQDVTQTAVVMQTATGNGSNSSSIRQDINQSCNGSGGAPTIDQKQEAHQTADVTQDTAAGSGKNDSDVRQSQNQDEHAVNAATINQFQNTDDRFNPPLCFFGENECYTLLQTSGSGKNDTKLDQRYNESQHANNSNGGQQAQGGCDTTTTPCAPLPFETGMVHDFDQSGAGVSTQSSNQDENQAQHRDNVGAMTASQVGPTRKDEGFQNGNDQNRAKQEQNSKQESKGGATVAVSTDMLSDACDSSGLCSVHQHVDSNGAKADNSITAPAFFASIDCAGGQTTTTSESGPPDTAPSACEPFTSTNGD